MLYAILIYGDEKQWERRAASDSRQMSAEYAAYTKELTDAGALRGGERLEPSSKAATLRPQAGKVVKTDGPFIETKEQLGGFYLIEATDLARAVEWGSRCPGARTGVVEVRPVVPMAK